MLTDVYVADFESYVCVFLFIFLIKTKLKKIIDLFIAQKT